MKFDHRIGRAAFATVTGLVVAWLAFQWITDPVTRAQRQAEETAVHASRELIAAEVGAAGLELVDPLAPNRKVGKVYIYAESPGWAVSGYYRHGEEDHWRPYLVRMNEDLSLHSFRTEGP
ncbi:MAG TPA: hypothetical protein VLA11_09645 [Woeseiaceae bacterium]|jgi:hypothetical protein|nr:hypothetical protein [Woeseiaceae bacterium]